MAAAPLRGLKVLDLGQLVAAPYCARLLGALGADVVKIEPPYGDPSRDLGALAALDHDPERSPLFLFLNQGKQSVVLDLHQAEGRRALQDLVVAADVLVENFPPRHSSALGLRYDALARINPMIVVTAVTPFGLTGPYRDFPSEEIITAAMGGLLSQSRIPEPVPLLPPGWQSSYLSGAAAAVGTMLALHHRERTGLGQQVDVSQMEVVASILEGALTASSAGRVARTRRRDHIQGDGFTLLLPCKDGHVVVSIASEADWESFSYFVGDARLREPRFVNSKAREQNVQALEDVLSDWLRDVTRSEFFANAQRWRFPCCAVLSPGELDSDPQHRSRRFFVPVHHPRAGKLRYPRPPFRFSRGRLVLGPAPLLAEHQTTAFERWRGLARHGDSTCKAPERPAAPLSGTRVVDLTSMWAGPLCTRLLADAGAEVIKVELAARPDGTRREQGPPSNAENIAPLFAELNRNKLGITLDLRRPADRADFFSLVAEADALVENFSPRVMPNLGIDYPALRAINPRLVMLSMPAFGLRGPYRDGIAFGSGIEAMSGLAALSGYQDGPPMLQGVAYGDPVAGLHGAVGLLATLLAPQNRRGEHIELPQREALTQFIGEILVGHELEADRGSRLGNRHRAFGPLGCYATNDDHRWVAIAVISPEQWQSLCAAMGKPALAHDPRFQSAADRLASQDALDKIISTWTRNLDAMSAASLLQQAGVPAGPVLEPAELLVDPHLAERQFLRAESRTGYVSPGALCRLSAFPVIPNLPPPRLGEHNERILRDDSAIPRRTNSLKE